MDPRKSGRVGSGRVQNTGRVRVGSGRVGSGHDFAGFMASRVGSALRILSIFTDVMFEKTT